MPRYRSIKNNDMVQHIMLMGGVECMLFRDILDKGEYLSIVKANMEKYKFKLYAYCLLDNCAYFIVDMLGADLSAVMKCINVSYTSRYNKKYKRYGPLFMDRYKSRIIEENDKLFNMIDSIHNEAYLWESENNNDEGFPFSSLGIYAGYYEDKYKLIDVDFMKMVHERYYFSKVYYLEHIKAYINKDIKKVVNFLDVKCEYYNYKHKLIRDITPEEILEFVKGYTGTRNVVLNERNRDFTKDRAICAMIMRNLCEYKGSDICRILGVSQGSASRLISLGYNIAFEDEEYKDIVMDFVSKNHS